MATRSRESLAREAFGKDLKAARLRQGLSIATASRHAGVNQGTWSRYEAGVMRPGIDKAPALAKGLGIPIAALFPLPNTFVIAEVQVSQDTLNEARKQGDSYITTLSQRIAKGLEPLLKHHATTTTRTKPSKQGYRRRDLRDVPELRRFAENRRNETSLASH